MNPTITTIIAERLQRQQLTPPISAKKNYIDLFRTLQPVSTVFFTRPGDPPSLIPRTVFDDKLYTDKLRAQGTIVKGRFLGGGIGYVLAEDLDLYANTFQRPIKRFTEIQRTLLETLQRTGPLTPRQLKEETGFLNKEIMPALHRLQKAFLVYEAQLDSDWERGWYSFPSEWPDVNLSKDKFESAATQILLRFLKAHVFATFQQIKDWSQLPIKTLCQLLARMETSKQIEPKVIDQLGLGWMIAQDTISVADRIEPSVFMLHKADFLVRSHTTELKQQFGTKDILQYLLIDGKFQGAVLGHWRIGPHDVSDITLTIPPAQQKKRRAEILQVVAQYYHPPRSRILKYAGKKLD